MIKTNIEGFEIKLALVDDSALIYKYILDLAEHENAIEGVVGSEQDLIESVWKKERAQAYLLYYEGIDIGFFIVCSIFSTFICDSYLYLDDLFINEEYRNRGFGKEVFSQLANIVIKENLTRLEWYCYNDNETGINFYTNGLKAKEREGLLRFCLDIDELKELANKK